MGEKWDDTDAHKSRKEFPVRRRMSMGKFSTGMTVGMGIPSGKIFLTEIPHTPTDRHAARLYGFWRACASG